MEKTRLGIAIAIFLGILFFMQQCNNNKLQQLKGEYNILKENRAEDKAQLKIIEEERKAEKDSLLAENEVLKEQKKKSNEKITSLETKIKNREEQAEKDRERIKNLNNIEVAEEINKIYDTKDAVATNESVNLNGELPNQILQTVYDADECQDVVADKDKIIAEKDVIIEKSEKETANFSNMLNSAEKEITAHKELEKSSQKSINNLEKQNKKLRTKSTLDKIFIGVGFVGGFLIGNELAK